MIKRLFTRVVESISVTTTEVDTTAREETLKLATAVLMIDVARADHIFEDSEFDRVLKLVERHFALTAEQAAELVNIADEKARPGIATRIHTAVTQQPQRARKGARYRDALGDCLRGRATRQVRRLVSAQDKRFAARKPRTCHAPET